MTTIKKSLDKPKGVYVLKSTDNFDNIKNGRNITDLDELAELEKEFKTLSPGFKLANMIGREAADRSE